MEQQPVETVTIRLETYEAMKTELKELREQVQEKTIERQVLHPVYGIVMVIVFIVFVLWLSIFY